MDQGCILRFLYAKRVAVAANAYAGLVLVDRLGRPIFWWLWLTFLAAVMLIGQKVTWRSLLIAVVGLELGILAEIGFREWAWHAGPGLLRILLIAMPVLVATGAAVSALRGWLVMSRQ